MAGEGRGGALRELVAYMGFDLEEGKLDRAEHRIEGLKEKSELLTRALEAVGIALGLREIGEFIHSQIEMGSQVTHTAEVLGVTNDELQRFQYAANMADVGAEGAATALGFLNKAIGSVGEGNAEAAATFAKLHVELKNTDGSARPLSEVIGDVADGLAALPDHGAKTVAAMSLFGRSGRELIPLLNKGRAGIEGLYKEFDRLGGGLSEEFLHASEEAETATKNLNFTMKGLSSEIGVALLPTVAELAQDVAEGLVAFREWTKDTHLLRNALITLGVIAGILVITWGILNIEILLVVAALALLALAVDDVIPFFEGGDSVLGRFLDRLYGVGKSKDIAKDLEDAWKKVSKAFGDLWDAVKELGPTLKDLFNTFAQKSDIDNAKTGIQGMADAVKSLADNLTASVKWLNDLIKKFDDFAKAHPWVVHAAQRSLHQVEQGNVGIGGALKAVGGDVLEAVTGDTSIQSYDEPTPGKAKTVALPSDPTKFNYDLPRGNVQQHNETHITLNGLPSTDAAAAKVQTAVRDGQSDANSSAWYGIGGGGPP